MGNIQPVSQPGNDRLIIPMPRRQQASLSYMTGGPNRVSRWMRQRGTSDIDEFVEEISLDETRLFVKLVMNNYAEYVTHFSNQSNKTQ